jgi:hypothetical protein
MSKSFYLIRVPNIAKTVHFSYDCTFNLSFVTESVQKFTVTTDIIDKYRIPKESPTRQN